MKKEEGGEMKEKRGVFNVRGSCKVRRGGTGEGGKGYAKGYHYLFNH